MTRFWIGAAILLLALAAGCLSQEPGSEIRQSDVASTGSANTVDGYRGEVLAGNTTPLLAYTPEDFSKAITEKHVVLLYFYAAWCPVCKDELPHLYDAFNQLHDPDVIGFRVHYNDQHTTEAEEALAAGYGISYQHTKVILVNGTQTVKSPETWTTPRYLEELRSASQTGS